MCFKRAHVLLSFAMKKVAKQKMKKKILTSALKGHMLKLPSQYEN